MKYLNIRNILAVVALLLVSSCSKEEVSHFDTSYCSLNLWVGTEVAVYETTTYNYSYSYEEGSVTFYAQISGMPADHDRTFRLEAFGEDYDKVANTIRMEDYVIPAGEIGGTFKVYFNSQKLSDPDMFSDNDGQVSFRMVSNDIFSIGTENRQEFTVVLKNYLAKPDNWDTANFPKMPLSRYFGTYSKVKYQFMIEVLGLIDFEINNNAQTGYDEATNTVSIIYAESYLKQKLQSALNDYNATHDTPLTDEFGALVTF
ncbi:MAG: DUF4843 domain-containing protein [Prevotellaceae bacterium]|nr:DUF4843 domain-containing protein [Prevotellaceae bacterium]